MKKSKFLKKSLAMLLALMLVVAMIPLSASAALPDDLEYLYINGAQVSVDDLEVNVTDLTAKVRIETNGDLSAQQAELRVFEKGGSVNYDTAPARTTSTQSKTFDPATYADVNGNTATIKMELWNTNGTSSNYNDDKRLASYTLTINKVDASTTTNLEVVKQTNAAAGDGAYDAYVEGDDIYVITARHTGTGTTTNTPITSWTANTQKSVRATITVRPLDSAKITAWTDADNGTNKTGTVFGSQEISANDGDTVTVTSANGGNSTTYKIHAIYEEALEGFTATVGETEYKATITDGNNDDVEDTITLVLPKSVLKDSKGDDVPSPTLPVSFDAYGNVNPSVNVTIAGNTVAIADNTMVTFTNLASGDVNGTVTVSRLNGFTQEYKLVVKTEDSTNTAVEYVRVNATEATVSGSDISAVLPNTYNGQAVTQATLKDVVIYTEDTVESVVLNGTAMHKYGSSEATKANLEKAPDGQVSWILKDVDLSQPRTLTVTAEDNHFEEYTISTSMATVANVAGLTAVWLRNGANTYEGIPDSTTNTFKVEVPYMTTDISSWDVLVTPASGSKIQYNGNYDLVNGVTKASDISLNKVDLTTGAKTTVTAVNGADAKITKEYTIQITLKAAKSANTLTGLDFTSQISTNTDDKAVVRALSDENQFHAYIDEQSNNTYQVGTINLSVPQSLRTHTEDNNVQYTYNNIVTGFEVPEGAVAYAITGNSGTNYVLEELASTTLPLAGTLTGTKIGNTTTSDVYSQILVLPEQIARQVKAGEAAGYVNYVPQVDANKYGTLYTVNVVDVDYETGDDLLTIKIGDVNLQINTNDNTVTGTLPWSYTVPADKVTSNGNGTYTIDTNKSKFMTFTVSDYAAMRYLGGSAYWAVNSNGGADQKAAPQNLKFFFVQEAANKVALYIYDGYSIQKTSDNSLLVRAEDRLNPATGYKVSETKYTFNLKWQNPSKEADIKSFSVAGQTGIVNNTNDDARTITVNVPYGTDMKGLVATFEASLGATVKVGDTLASAVDFVSGVTSLNYTNPVYVYVISEDGSVTNRYTITLDEGLSFSDVNPGDWFYDNVMDAANNGYISGMGDGTFAPTKATTRAEFASMIAKAMGYEANPDAPSMFPDVADDFWGKAAINFCAQNGIITGYDDGTFQPNKAITRQEAASILRNAFKLTESSSETFPDDSAISGWAKESVYIVKASGLMKGDAGTGNFRPTDTIIRAEAASILMNAKYAGLIK